MRGMGGAGLAAGKLGFNIPLMGMYLAAQSERSADKQTKTFAMKKEIWSNHSHKAMNSLGSDVTAKEMSSMDGTEASPGLNLGLEGSCQSSPSQISLIRSVVSHLRLSPHLEAI